MYQVCPDCGALMDRYKYLDVCPLCNLVIYRFSPEEKNRKIRNEVTLSEGQN
jgi:hypothetical protein